MKTYKYLYSKMLDEDIIRAAWKKLRKGKTKRIEVQQIEADFENEVKNIYEETWKEEDEAKTYISSV